MNKTLKKVLSLIIAFTMLIPANLAFAFYGTNPAEVLEDLGIATAVKFPYFHVNYTRMEFARMLCKLDAEYFPAVADTELVHDVDKQDDKQAAAYTIEKKYLALDGNGNFNPNEKVTYNDAVIALVTLLDYDRVALANGGTVSAYLNSAKRIGLVDGVVAPSDGYPTKSDLATMILNALEILPAEISYDGALMAQPTVLESKNLITGEAKLLSTDSRSVGAVLCEEGYINLDGKIYKAECDIDDALAGRLVKYYLRSVGGVKTVVSLADISGESLTLYPDDIYDVKVGRSQVEFKYGDGKRVSIPHTATIIVNGKPGDLTKELFSVFTSGTMEVFDSDNNGGYDTVDMSLCVTEVVESASIQSNAINTKYTKQHIDFDGNDNAFALYENNMKVGMAAIKADSVVSIACDAYTISAGKLSFDYSKAEFVRVYVSNRKVTGVLEHMSAEECVIDERTFVPGSLLNVISDMNVKNPLELASTYKFSIDAFGAICDFELVESGEQMQYGYLMDAGVNSNAFDSKMQVKILNNDSELLVYDVKEKYFLDGDREVIDGGYTLPAVLNSRQLIRYKLSGGVITAIDTANIGDKEVPDTSLSLDYSAKATAMRYWGDFNGFEDHRTVVASDTKVFYVTDDAAAEESAFKAESPLIFASSTFYNYESYDIGEMGKTACILVYADVSDDISFMNRAYMVEKVVKTLNDSGDDVTRLYLHGYAGSITKDLIDGDEFIFTDVSEATNKTLSDIRKGDIVRFAANASGKIVKLERAFAVEKEPTMHIDDLTASGLHYEYGTLYNTNATHFEAVAKTDLSDVTEDEKFVFAYKYPAKIPVYNMIDGTITLYSGDFQNIPTYINSAEKVTVFIHMGAYAFYSAAVYIWE